ncbi:hypothetical protein DYBT9275_03145 [Dyadobacter sp. CECT 9275]|uniref:Uncharacterized protein n=1 Tax=Dyadobacter helix TaxID=2822344 RepID=A0A916NCB3_9BACT|nr:hypothetical protein [Dyadobacter sp. CECT 9275]CAG5003406.1 hypothetical protein DYBT9275_03145 [Dyadobacter sp. CECT 9275]
MKIAVVLFGLLAWVSCHDENEVLDNAVLEADGQYVNMLASDGCSWHFSVKSGDSTISLAPSDASFKVIEEALGKSDSYYSFTDVHLKYSLTGNKKDVKCGWGHTSQFDEIKVLQIHKR